MFGYVTVNRQMLTPEETELYQAYYCGFCAVLRRYYGPIGQLTLSYDMTFLILLLSKLYDVQEEERTARCGVHPFRVHRERTNTYTQYAADMNVILSYYHCDDDWKDEKKLGKLAVREALGNAFRKACRRYPGKAEGIRRELEALSECERQKVTQPDLPAGCFGRLMAELFDIEQDIWQEDLRELGFYLGKFIYLMDAYEDCEEDYRKGCYNVFGDSFREADFDDRIAYMLKMMLAKTCQAFERLPIVEGSEIMRNILYSGVWTRYCMTRDRRKGKEDGSI